MKSLIYSTFLLTLFSCDQPNLDCMSFKNGLYINESTIEGMPDSYIFRNDSIQWEVLNGFSDTLFQKIKWIAPCTYELVYIKGRATMGMQSNVFKVEILQTDLNSYRYKSKLLLENALEDEGVIKRHPN